MKTFVNVGRKNDAGRSMIGTMIGNCVPCVQRQIASDLQEVANVLGLVCGICTEHRCQCLMMLCIRFVYLLQRCLGYNEAREQVQHQLLQAIQMCAQILIGIWLDEIRYILIGGACDQPSYGRQLLQQANIQEWRTGTQNNLNHVTVR